jgi:hypothetical protein
MLKGGKKIKNTKILLLFKAHVAQSEYTNCLLNRDIMLKIMSKLDIDTRRTLGIYTKLGIPHVLSVQITGCLLKAVYTQSYGPSVNLGPLRVLRPNTADKQTMYQITRYYYGNPLNYKTYITHVTLDVNIKGHYVIMYKEQASRDMLWYEPL